MLSQKSHQLHNKLFGSSIGINNELIFIRLFIIIAHAIYLAGVVVVVAVAVARLAMIELMKNQHKKKFYIRQYHFIIIPFALHVHMYDFIVLFEFHIIIKICVLCVCLMCVCAGLWILHWNNVGRTSWHQQ